ncbi:peptidase G2 autoproteolytic cleavage domain-containing protein [Antarcticimicrobium sediminis]|uniref:DUF2793 domain-containing protein n=1 Tax=Antarcticimicrobium sediminis TaxID=2546227 RepID=A0A4R5EIL4_9RHOB|nr:peptidase G2 autoproteolytic cleavage domain-containing protein [Antarcticimicrobium sediminis]TDE34258.1 DUF2793 domain-containing protein [Antarcticimicrobium sediminis]
MPDTTPILALPVLVPNQAQPYVTHNAALRRLDILVQLSVMGFDAETPPALPEEGDLYALGPVPLAEWAGQPNQLAAWIDGSWLFLAPQPGWRAWDQNAGLLRVWDGVGWVRPAAELDNVAGLGIGTASGPVNRLAVKSEAVLFSHDGADQQVKINKASDADTASLLFQSGWTGHAEMGLAGGRDFSIKLSADGSSWTEALSFDAGSGDLGLGGAPGGGRAEIHQPADAPALQANCTHAGFAATLQLLRADRAASPDFNFLRCLSDAAGTGDLEFRLSGDGNGSCDGAWSGGGADYAEWFEWADGNPKGEDRTGLSVVLDGPRIRPAQPGEVPIGVISGAPAVIGDGDMDRWRGKYLRDDFGRLLWEGDTEAGDQRQRRLNPAFDPTQGYTPRATRPEWAMVGLIGKLRLRKGQPVDPRWIPMRDVSSEVEEWLLR